MHSHSQTSLVPHCFMLLILPLQLHLHSQQTRVHHRGCLDVALPIASSFFRLRGPNRHVGCQYWSKRTRRMPILISRLMVFTHYGCLSYPWAVGESGVSNLVRPWSIGTPTMVVNIKHCLQTTHAHAPPWCIECINEKPWMNLLGHDPWACLQVG